MVARNGSCPCWYPPCAGCCDWHLTTGLVGPSQHLASRAWGQAHSPGRECPPQAAQAPGSHRALPPQSPSPEPGVNTSPLCLAVELDRTLGHQEPHWKEFRFDLTQIPAGEAVTAAEFRIYKLPSTHPLNRTYHVSMFEVVRERANRCLSCAPTPGQASVSVSGSALRRGAGMTFPRGQRGASWAHTLTDAGCLAQGPGT